MPLPDRVPEAERNVVKQADKNTLVGSTPAMASGLTDSIWNLKKLLLEAAN